MPQTPEGLEALADSGGVDDLAAARDAEEEVSQLRQSREPVAERSDILVAEVKTAVEVQVQMPQLGQLRKRVAQGRHASYLPAAGERDLEVLELRQALQGLTQALDTLQELQEAEVQREVPKLREARQRARHLFDVGDLVTVTPVDREVLDLGQASYAAEQPVDAAEHPAAREGNLELPETCEPFEREDKSGRIPQPLASRQVEADALEATHPSQFRQFGEILNIKVIR
jgi:hypothetical protein